MDILLYNYNRFSLIYFLILIKINIIKNECNEKYPFKTYNGDCSASCSKYEAENNKCILDNSIIKEQFPNNIIFIGEEGKSYFNFLSFSNGDFIFETYSSDFEKIFYGLKNNGRNYFHNEFNYLNSPDDEDYNLYGINSIFIKNEKEYFLNLVGNKYIEIYDFNQQRIFSNSTDQMFGYQNDNFIGSLINLGNNTYIYSYSSEDIYYYGKVVTIMKFKLNLDENNKININIIDTKEIGNNIYTDMISCFKTEKTGVIICFYYFGKYVIYYNIAAYTQDLNHLCNEQKKINDNYNDFSSDTFIYNIAFKEDIGAFIYYKNDNPVIFFREYINYSFQNYFNDIEEIILDQFYLKSSKETNDFIKISDDKLGFFSVSQDSEIIYIIIINFINKNKTLFSNQVKIKIRYYSIELNNLVHMKLGVI